MTEQARHSLARLFKRCLTADYVQVGRSANYAAVRQDDVLYLYFQDSNGAQDWRSNLDFPARPYREMDGIRWYAHRGFVRVWQEIEPYIAPYVADPTLHCVVTVGYSHGGALAVLCHEYLWFHRPDLRRSIEGYAFGCPRVLWGARSGELLARWERFFVVRNIDDVVTHLPPRALGYFHVGHLLEIGEKGKYSPIDAHRAENILAELER
ncbi:MAG: lipase family protein [Ruminococcaceae bacterium]|nr:lipase family protein [Oscillospiraceae bacterium]